MCVSAFVIISPRLRLLSGSDMMSSGIALSFSHLTTGRVLSSTSTTPTKRTRAVVFALQQRSPASVREPDVRDNKAVWAHLSRERSVSSKGDCLSLCGAGTHVVVACEFWGHERGTKKLQIV